MVETENAFAHVTVPFLDSKVKDQDHKER